MLRARVRSHLKLRQCGADAERLGLTESVVETVVVEPFLTRTQANAGRKSTREVDILLQIL